jgi:hypothetical protein
VFSISIQKSCHLCFRLFYKCKALFSKLFGVVDCCAVALTSGINEPSRRVTDFNLAAPNCQCELHRTSWYSPCPVRGPETLTRFIFSPLHVKKNGELKPSLFSHIETSGCSVQREIMATNAELLPWIKKFLANQNKQAWHGTVSGSCADLRRVMVTNSTNRSLAVYDTAEQENPSHAEVFQTQYVIDDADKLELRREIMKVFGDGKITLPASYRSGSLWQELGDEFQNRSQIN